MKKSFPAILSNLKKIRATIKDFLKIYKVDLKIIKNIQLAVDEAVTNIIKHSYKGENVKNVIDVELELIGDKFFIHLCDNGNPINEKQIKPRKLDNVRPGGLGTYFINKIIDEVIWKKSDKWVNHLTLVKSIDH